MGCEAGKLYKLVDKVLIKRVVQAPAVAQLAETQKHMAPPWRTGPPDQRLLLSCVVLYCHRQGDGLLAGERKLGNGAGSSV